MWRPAVPDLRQLRTFVAVAEELNFTRAAERLHLAQQAVSKSVRQLEDELGVPLLERTTRDVRLTAAGAALLETGRDALAAADAAFTRARDVGRGLSGTVRVGLTPAVGPAVHEELLHVLRDGSPELGVSAVEVRPRDVARLLREREVDLVMGRVSADEPEIDSASLRPTPAVLGVPATHRLAGAESATMADLDGERMLIWSSPGTPFTDMLLARVHAAGARVEPVVARVTGGLAMTELADNDAVALLPAGSPQTAGVTQVPLRDGVTLPLVVLWAAGTQPPAVARIRAGMSTSA
jgi:DNA-binding transcriptional LysR family regulator